MQDLIRDETDIRNRIAERNDGVSPGSASTSTKSREKETEREMLIRTGKITPFSEMSGLEMEVEDSGGAAAKIADIDSSKHGHQKFPSLSFNETIPAEITDVDISERSKATDQVDSKFIHRDRPLSQDEFQPTEESDSSITDSEKDIDDDDDQYSSDDASLSIRARKAKSRVKKNRKGWNQREEEEEEQEQLLRHVDDGIEAHYQKRLLKWVKARRIQRFKDQVIFFSMVICKVLRAK